ncbi:3-hydroxyacyl-ACP dehydratase FabZ [Ruminiclostridium papyrosolvens]|uniref:3-hydroxyacyl-[acyl-carrier-protein] dehydratase n=1 Tax=Ruminiclostridium papyrosolvens C7 TaxID=1330534 RepID=U4R3E9_9FIRM|nr:3-hydroxyacyl-ACP dehydratase FabZ [Ruminiclostridium papyrosolvens]EPR12151.1 3-hydroxyacyl-ACP dehydratase [Ruminiclostridium papyrosolvens C7]
MKFTTKEIMSILPHKAPFLLVDKVIECEPGKYALGIKNVTIDEPFFQGHFPTEPILPGVLIVESIAQVTAVMYCAEFMESMKQDASANNLSEVDIAKKIAEHVGYLVEIKSMKFKKTVHPGDTLHIQVWKKTTFASLSLIEAKVVVDNEIVAEGKISVSEKN